MPLSHVQGREWGGWGRTGSFVFGAEGREGSVPEGKVRRCCVHFFKMSLPPLGKINACSKYLKAPISLPSKEKV